MAEFNWQHLLVVWENPLNTTTTLADSQEKKARQFRSICVPFTEEQYAEIVTDPSKYREYLRMTIKNHPELFPHEILHGYRMKDFYLSKKRDLLLRRIKLNTTGIQYTLRPSFVMPYMTGKTKEIKDALFFRKFDVPYWAIAHVYGKNAMYWYRLENQIGRNSLVGTTIKDPDKLPENLLADEKHTRLLGEKHYIAMTVGNECILGASVATNAGEKALTASYGVFKEEACQVKKDYAPGTVNIDGWAATQNAWKTLFSAIVIIGCFLHVYIKIRDRTSKKYQAFFSEAASKLWDCYKAENKRSFSQRVRALVQWAEKNTLPAVFIDVFSKLRTNRSRYACAYDHPDAHRTSNMLDRLMQHMDRHLFSTRYFHGSLEAAELNIRGWALIQNFAPYNPITVTKHNGLSCPAERLNRKRYHDSWLENLLISASLGGYSDPPQNPLQ